MILDIIGIEIEKQMNSLQIWLLTSDGRRIPSIDDDYGLTPEGKTEYYLESDISLRKQSYANRNRKSLQEESY